MSASPTSQPVVTVVTSTYQRAEMVGRAIASVLAQEFVDWEMCVVGDCTPDHTADVVASFDDARVRFYNLPEKSPPRAHGSLAKNHAIREMARGAYIAYLDDDDVYRPDHLSTLVGYLQAHPHAVMVYCRCGYRDVTTGKRLWGNPFQRWLHDYSHAKLERYNYIDTDCVVHTRALLEEVGYWDPKDYFDDYQLWLRISRKYPLHYVNKVLADKYVDIDPFFIRWVKTGGRILGFGRGNPPE